MPPKAAAKKAGDVEDFSDIASLPPAKIFKFSVIMKSFFSQENRDKVTKRVSENLVATSVDKIKLLTREDIMTYGKTKGTIMDSATLQGLPTEDPRRNLSEDDMVARAAADRIFELSVLVRRSKKEKLTKLEEEAAARAGEGQEPEKVALDQDVVDAMIYMPDYPQTKSEAFALARAGHSLNGVFEVNELPKSDADDNEDEEEKEGAGGSEEEEEDLASQKSKPASHHGEQKQMTPDSQELQQEMQRVLNQLQIARSLSSASSSLRQMAFMKASFRDESKSVEAKDAEGNVVKKMKPAEDVFLTDLYQFQLDKYAQYYVQYLKFKELVTVDPLMPDKQALEQIQALEAQAEQEKQMIEEHEALLEEEIANLKEEGKESEDQAVTDRSIEEARDRVSSFREQLKTQEEGRVKALRTLQRRKKASLDDEREPAQFKLDAYRSDFVENPETANNIQSVLSAMITQIESDKNWELNFSQQHKESGLAHMSEADNTTVAESLDDLFDEFEHEINCGLKLKERGPDPIEGQSLADTLSLKHNCGIEIHEENDKTLEVKQSLPLSLVETEANRVKQISERERGVLKNLNLPGKDRYLMPAIPTKSQRTRDSENPSFYPFCTLPITDAERMLLLKAFQQLIKQNFIDQGAKGEKRAEKYRVFNRTYENHMTPDIFRQVFSDALIDEPDAATLYYPRTDSLLVALYNKTTNKVAQGSKPSSAPQQLDSNEPDGNRSWRAAYRVMPDFQNWITFFADEIVFEQQVAVPIPEPEPVDHKAPPKDTKAAKGAEIIEPDQTTALTINVMKYSMDEDLLPERMLDIEDDKVQNIAERSALVYPDDNSTMRVDHFMVGGKTFSKSIVVKDNLKFGLRPRDQTKDKIQQQVIARKAGDTNTIDEQDDPSEGLVQYRPTGDTEFWLHFENGTKMGVEQVQLKRLPYKVIRTDPEPPSAEEIAKKEELIRQQQAAIAKQKTVKGGGTIPEVEIPKTPEPTFLEKELNHLDTLFTDDMLEATQSMTTLTLKNGLILQLLGSGEISQMHDTELSSEGKEGTREMNRIVTREGIVIRQLHNRDSEVLYPDGVVAHFSKQNMEWVVTNNKGKRVSYKENLHKDLVSIPCATETDAVTNAKMMIREDNVCSVEYKDGSRYVQHADGTQMHTSACGKEIRIEKIGYAQNTIRLCGANDMRPTSQPSLKSVDERALDARVLETYIPDGSMIQTYLDKVPTKKRGSVESVRHVVKRSDLSVIVVDGEGHISVISSNARAALNEAGGKARLDYTERDNDWLAELTRGAGQYVNNVYQAHISSKASKSKISVKNSQDDVVFTLKNDHTLTKKVTSVPQWNNKLPPKQAEETGLKTTGKRGRKGATAEGGAGQAKVVGDLELENVGGYQVPYSKYYQYPRLFVVQNDGSARELLAASQLDYAMRKKKVQIDQSIKQKMSDVFNNSSLANHYFLTKVINMKQRELELQKLNNLEFPENASDVLNKRIEVAEPTLLIPKQEQYLYTQIFQLPDCDMMAQEIFLRDYQNYLQWKMGQLRYDTEFALVHLPVSKDQPVDWNAIADEEYANKKINTRILKHRAQPFHNFQAEEFKQNAMKNMAASGEISEYRKKMTSRVNSQQRSRDSNSQGSARSKLNSQERAKRDEQMRASHTSRLSDNAPLSEKSENLTSIGHESNHPAKMNEKEAREAQREADRRRVVAVKLTEDRTRLRKEKIGAILDERDAKKNTPEFVTKYFTSYSGTNFLVKNPPMEVPIEVLTRMKQRMEREGRQTHEGQSKMEAEQQAASIEAGSAQQRSNDLVMVGEGMDDKDNPIVALEPDDNLKQGSAFMGSKKAGTSIGMEASMQEGPDATQSGNQTLPSLYMQEKMYLYNKEQEHLLKAEEHHIVKTKDFNVYGRLREEQFSVKSLAKSKVQTELNEKFITTECITDRRVKVSSMAPRYYMNAPSVENVRKQGQHQMILSAINKKQTFAELINQANSMVTGVLHDNLKRALNIMPSSIVFGGLRPGSTNEITVTVKNEDMLGQRINIKPLTDKRILVKQETFGLIAPGMTKQITVSIRVPDDAQVPATIKDTLTIMAKHDIYKLPITAQILPEDEWVEENKNMIATMGKSVQNSRVRERLNRALAQSRQSGRESDGPELLTRKPRNVDESLKSGDDLAVKSMVSGDFTDPSRM